MSMQDTLGREQVSTQGTFARKHVITQGTLAREHIFSTYGTQFNININKNYLQVSLFAVMKAWRTDTLVQPRKTITTYNNIEFLMEI